MPATIPDTTAATFAREGFIKVTDLLQPDVVGRLLRLYDRFLDGSIETGAMRADLGAGSDGHRRALILNFRPEAMIRLERELGFDHGKSGNVRKNRNVGTK